MRVVVLAPDVPFPPNSGGRADIWRRIQAMAALGHEVMLVAPIDSGTERLTTDAEDAIGAVVRDSFFFPIRRSRKRTVSRLLRVLALPWHASTRVPDQGSFDQLCERVRLFQPNVLWLDGPWLSVVADSLLAQLRVPSLYRSQNIEFKYMRGQARAALSLRDRIALRISCIGLKRFEIQAMQRADAVFDISVDDLKYWEDAGMPNMHWLPPLPELAFKERSATPLPSDLVFLGNLGTPNNVRGVEWLVTEILPRLQAQLPNIRCRVVGSNPTPFISQLLAGASGLELCANVPDPTPYLFGASVLINPVRTGSGVQVKMLDMLMTDAPIVTTSQGTRGLPPEFRALFRIADDADAFAQAVCEEIITSSVDLTARAAAREVFSVAAVGRALKLVLREKSATDRV